MASVPPDQTQRAQPPHFLDSIEKALSGEKPEHDVVMPGDDHPKMEPGPDNPEPLPHGDPMNQSAPIDDLPRTEDQREEFEKVMDATEVASNDGAPIRDPAGVDSDASNQGSSDSHDNGEVEQVDSSDHDHSEEDTAGHDNSGHDDSDHDSTDHESGEHESGSAD